MTLLGGRTIFKNIYLIFLDREICIASNTYNLEGSYFLEAFEICALMTFEPIAMSAGNLLEHKAYPEIYKAYQRLFIRGDIFLLSKDNDLFELVYRKNSQYQHVILDHNAERDYSAYTGKSWKRDFDGPLVFEPKYFDTTEILIKKFVSALDLSGDEFTKKVVGTLENTRGKAVTIEVFRQSAMFTEFELRRLAKIISEDYTSTYQNETQSAGFSHTGLVARNFDGVTTANFDYRIYRDLFKALSLKPRSYQELKSWLEFRGDVEHRRFIHIIREFTKDVEYDGLQRVPEIIRRIIPRDINGAQENRSIPQVIEKISDCFEKNGYEDFEALYLDAVTIQRKRMMNMKSQKVFVVHGRDIKAKNLFFDFVRRLGLDPIEFEEAREIAHQATGEASPYVGKIVEHAMKEARGIIILLTPDEEVRLKSPLRVSTDDKKRRFSARPNVIFEAGAALALYPERTIIIRMGNADIPSDLAGRHYVSLSNDVTQKTNVRSRLASVGYTMSDAKSDWLKSDLEITE
jgi:predicted nucleotide-binding protein